MRKNNIEFRKINFEEPEERLVNKVYYVVENKRSDFEKYFYKMNHGDKAKTKRLLLKMAQNENFQSTMITYQLKKYSYGEIKPQPHRFFFFRKCGNNFIFFGYCKKKKNSLGDQFYKDLDKKRKRYEEAFERFKKRD